MAEKTSAQSINIVGSDGVLPKPFGDYQWPKKVRAMRRDPTIGLARALCIAPILVTNWSVEELDGAPLGAKDFIDSQLQPLRQHILSHSLRGTIDFGWAPFEKVFTARDGLIVIDKLKPLLQDQTEIVVVPKTGAFDGLKNVGNDGAEVLLPLEYSLLFSREPEGTDWYGESLMKRAETAYDGWKASEHQADRYENKIAGSHWVVKYPSGVTSYRGEEVSNDIIAEEILQSLEANARIRIPKEISRTVRELSEASALAWEIEILSDNGAGRTTFVERQTYYDKLKVRALEIPERAVLEGQFGTKAEASEHADFAITNIENRHAEICQTVNWHLVNQLLRYNFGTQYENSVYISPMSLSDPAREFLRNVYTSILTSTEGILDEIDSIDRSALKDKLGIPVNVTI